MGINPGTIDVSRPINVFIEVPLAKTYTLVQYSQDAFSIVDLVAKMSAGTATATLLINGVAVTGIDSVALDNTEKTFAATAANAVAIGDTVTLTVAAPVGTQDLAISVRCA